MISFNIDYKNWKIYYENSSLSEGLDGVYTAIGDVPYELLNINVSEIRSKVISDVKGSKTIKEALNSIKMKDYAVGEYADLIENLVFEILYSNYYKPLFTVKINTTKPKFSKKVTLMSDKDWVVIKKLSGEDDIEPREVASFLFNQKASILTKIYEKNPKYSTILEDMTKELKGKRKNVNSLLSAYDVSSDDAFKFLIAASVVGYTLTPNTELLKKTFPEFKPPAIKGRKPKK